MEKINSTFWFANPFMDNNEKEQQALDEFNEMYANDNEFDFKFGEHEDWCVEPVEVLP